jgi:peroxiredoxin
MKHIIVVLLLLSASARPASPPQLELKDIQGNTHTLAEYRGKIVLLNFWATWCIPCKTEMPIFTEVYRKYHDRGVVVLAASLDDETTQKYVSQYARSYKMEFPILINANADTMRELGLGETIPSTVFLDTDGNIAGKVLGQAKKKDVLHRLEWLLGNQEGEAPKPILKKFTVQ